MEFLKEMFTTPVIWFLIGLILALLEFILPGLIILFFGVGAWVVALICAIFNIGINSQLLIFILSSVLLLIFLRKKVKSIFMGKTDENLPTGQNLEDIIGQKVKVTEAIKPRTPGKVEFHGTIWKAESDEDVAEGAFAEIVRQDSITLIVKNIK